MSRWRKALIAASVGAAASTAFVVTSSIPGQAEASLVATYHCEGGIAGAGVDIEARITPQIEAGGLMNVRWGISYKNQLQRFGSPGYFPEGSSLDIEGTVDISGAWVGQLRPRGGQEQAELVPGDFLELPEGLSDQGSIGRSGTVRFKPGAMTVRFTPAEGEVMVNDKTNVQYSTGWAPEHSDDPLDDYRHDVHKTSSRGEIAKLQFVGTKVAYIGRRAPGLGDVRVFVDGETITDPLVEPGKDRSGNEMTGTETQEVLWESTQLDYGLHTIRVRTAEDKDAYVDAFRVTISDIAEPPEHDRATCELQGDPGAIDVTVPGPTDDPSDPPTDDPGDEDPGDEDPGDDPSEDPTDEDSTPPGGDSIGGDHVAVVPTGSSSGSSTPKSSKPTATRYVRAQVPKTPKGGVDSGEAPIAGEGPPLGLMTSGAVLVVGSVGGGLLLRRRRAAHAGGPGR
ncbi:hypothetical protein E1267_32915 [Nonomuraea longispora]|uniref:LPXTG cell wall anchor domain-containing protein n=1 Tax=Nonomuraea longispora TaxID=1848320 RepID=A0A4R4MXS0_9ACTN|nr:hypothetical protein [Nonomuraea longispora]TDC01089.1 hypothetical protein E1267_32915 [Nonomuraea longispora]